MTTLRHLRRRYHELAAHPVCCARCRVVSPADSLICADCAHDQADDAAADAVEEAHVGAAEERDNVRYQYAQDLARIWARWGTAAAREDLGRILSELDSAWSTLIGRVA